MKSSKQILNRQNLSTKKIKVTDNLIILPRLKTVSSIQDQSSHGDLTLTQSAQKHTGGPDSQQATSTSKDVLGAVGQPRGQAQNFGAAKSYNYSQMLPSIQQRRKENEYNPKASQDYQLTNATTSRTRSNATQLKPAPLRRDQGGLLHSIQRKQNMSNSVDLTKNYEQKAHIANIQGTQAFGQISSVQSGQHSLGDQGVGPGEPDPNYLLIQHNQIKMENRQRLKNVQCLEDLINFKVKTVADKLKEQQNLRRSRPLRHGDSLDQSFEQDSILGELANDMQGGSQTLLRDQRQLGVERLRAELSLNSSLDESGNEKKQLLNNSLFDSLKTRSQSSAQLTKNLAEQSLFQKHPSKLSNPTNASHSVATIAADDQDSMLALGYIQKMCDPLLANQILNKSYLKQGKLHLKQSVNQTEKLDDEGKYTIPEYLKQPPADFNRYIPLKEILPGHRPKPVYETEEEQSEAEAPDNVGNFAYKNPKARGLEKEINRKLRDIEEKAKKQVRNHNIDPLVMIQRYFDKMDRGTRGQKLMKEESQDIHDSSCKGQKFENRQRYLSSNYLDSKYQRLKHNGELEKLERKIYERQLKEGSEYTEPEQGAHLKKLAGSQLSRGDKMMGNSASGHYHGNYQDHEVNSKFQTANFNFKLEQPITSKPQSPIDRSGDQGQDNFDDYPNDDADDAMEQHSPQAQNFQNEFLNPNQNGEDVGNLMQGNIEGWNQHNEIAQMEESGERARKRSEEESRRSKLFIQEQNILEPKDAGAGQENEDGRAAVHMRRENLATDSRTSGDAGEPSMAPEAATDERGRPTPTPPMDLEEGQEPQVPTAKPRFSHIRHQQSYKAAASLQPQAGKGHRAPHFIPYPKAQLNLAKNLLIMNERERARPSKEVKEAVPKQVDKPHQHTLLARGSKMKPKEKDSEAKQEPHSQKQADLKLNKIVKRHGTIDLDKILSGDLDWVKQANKSSVGNSEQLSPLRGSATNSGKTATGAGAPALRASGRKMAQKTGEKAQQEINKVEDSQENALKIQEGEQKENDDGSGGMYYAQYILLGDGMTEAQRTEEMDPEKDGQEVICILSLDSAAAQAAQNSNDRVDAGQDGKEEQKGNLAQATSYEKLPPTITQPDESGASHRSEDKEGNHRSPPAMAEDPEARELRQAQSRDHLRSASNTPSSSSSSKSTKEGRQQQKEGLDRGDDGGALKTINYSATKSMSTLKAKEGPRSRAAVPIQPRQRAALDIEDQQPSSKPTISANEFSPYGNDQVQHGQDPSNSQIAASEAEVAIKQHSEGSSPGRAAQHEIRSDQEAPYQESNNVRNLQNNTSTNGEGMGAQSFQISTQYVSRGANITDAEQTLELEPSAEIEKVHAIANEQVAEVQKPDNTLQEPDPLSQQADLEAFIQDVEVQMLQAELLDGGPPDELIGSTRANGGTEQPMLGDEGLKAQDDSATARLRSDRAPLDPADLPEKTPDGELDEKSKRVTGLSQGDIRIVTNNRNGDDPLGSGPRSPSSPPQGQVFPAIPAQLPALAADSVTDQETHDEQVLFNQIIKEHLIRRFQWVPSRFSKFPRFGRQNFKVGSNENQTLGGNAESMKLINLNPQVLAILAGGFDEYENPPREVREYEQQNVDKYLSESPKQTWQTPALQSYQSTSGGFDPFSCVKVSKPNHVDNQILTSFRTITKQNNVISNTFKVLHQRFKAPSDLPTAVQNQIKSRGKLLYPIPIDEEESRDDLPDEADRRDTRTEQIWQASPQSASPFQRSQNASTLGEGSQFLIKEERGEESENMSERQKRVANEPKQGRAGVIQRSLQFPKSGAITKQERIERLQSLPIAVYDITAGQLNEEEGFGYRRCPYVIDKQDPAPPGLNVLEGRASTEETERARVSGRSPGSAKMSTGQSVKIESHTEQEDPQILAAPQQSRVLTKNETQVSATQGLRAEPQIEPSQSKNAYASPALQQMQSQNLTLRGEEEESAQAPKSQSSGAPQQPNPGMKDSGQSGTTTPIRQPAVEVAPKQQLLHNNTQDYDAKRRVLAVQQLGGDGVTSWVGHSRGQSLGSASSSGGPETGLPQPKAPGRVQLQPRKVNLNISSNGNHQVASSRQGSQPAAHQPNLPQPAMSHRHLRAGGEGKEWQLAQAPQERQAVQVANAARNNGDLARHGQHQSSGGHSKWSNLSEQAQLIQNILRQDGYSYGQTGGDAEAAQAVSTALASRNEPFLPTGNRMQELNVQVSQTPAEPGPVHGHHQAEGKIQHQGLLPKTQLKPHKFSAGFNNRAKVAAARNQMVPKGLSAKQNSKPPEDQGVPKVDRDEALRIVQKLMEEFRERKQQDMSGANKRIIRQVIDEISQDTKKYTQRPKNPHHDSMVSTGELVFGEHTYLPGAIERQFTIRDFRNERPSSPQGREPKVANSSNLQILKGQTIQVAHLEPRGVAQLNAIALRKPTNQTKWDEQDNKAGDDIKHLATDPQNQARDNMNLILVDQGPANQTDAPAMDKTGRTDRTAEPKGDTAKTSRSERVRIEVKVDEQPGK